MLVFLTEADTARDKLTSIWDGTRTVLKKIFDFLYFNIWKEIKDYRFIIFAVLVLVVVAVVIAIAKKHVPSRGRITDVYDNLGEKIKKKKDKKKEENALHDLPEEFYQSKK